MKVIYIANTRLPTEMAHGLQIMKMCEAFIKNDAEIELVVPMRFRISSLGKKDPFDYYKVKKIFKIKKIFSFDLTPLNRFLGPISSLPQALSFSFFVSIYLLFKKSNIIYSRDRFSLFFINKKNVVFEAHKIPKNLSLKGIEKIVVISKGIKQDLIKKGVESNKIFIASDGIDLDDFEIKENREECRKKLNLPLGPSRSGAGKKIVVYTGHLYKWKGVETLALSSKFLDKNTLIVIVGGIKWYLSNFKEFVKKNNLRNVLVLGHQDYSKIPYFLKAADCLVLTGTKKSKISKEHTSPMKMFEYMASKRPIVASSLLSLREVLNNKNAILVEPDSPQSLAKGIQKVLDNPELAKRISNQAHKNVQKYTWDKRTKRILDFIKS